MTGSSLYLADSNILLRLTKQQHPAFPVIRRAVDELARTNTGLAFTLHNMTEVWNVSTRPLVRNGFGLSLEDTAQDLDEIERNFTFLPDAAAVYHHWRRLVVKHRISGVQVHDARLAASMFAHGLTHILTFNIADFARFDGITTVHPATVEREPAPLP